MTINIYIIWSFEYLYFVVILVKGLFFVNRIVIVCIVDLFFGNSEIDVFLIVKDGIKLGIYDLFMMWMVIERYNVVYGDFVVRGSGIGREDWFVVLGFC